MDHSYDIHTPGFLEILVADSTLTCFCVCIRSSSFPLKWLSSSKMASLRLEMVASIKNGLLEAKHSSAWVMASMVPMWPQDSCFSLFVVGVGGLPFQNGMTGVSHCGLSRPGNGPMELIHRIFSLSISFSHPSLLELLTTLTTFGLAHYLS